MQRALLIEDNQELSQMLVSEIEQLGFALECAADGASGLLKGLEEDYRFVILDLQLPKLGGSEICKKLREHKPGLPIIVLTAQNQETSKVLLLELGADDYICKPFSLAELRARINAVLRRSAGHPAIANSATEEPVKYGRLTIDFVRRRVLLDDNLIELTATEFDILALFASEPGRPFHRDEIIEMLYGDKISLNDKNISNHINRIRAKIEPNPEEPMFVLTLRGVGYCFSDSLK